VVISQRIGPRAEPSNNEPSEVSEGVPSNNGPSEVEGWKTTEEPSEKKGGLEGSHRPPESGSVDPPPELTEESSKPRTYEWHQASVLTEFNEAGPSPESLGRECLDAVWKASTPSVQKAIDRIHSPQTRGQYDAQVPPRHNYGMGGFLDPNKPDQKIVVQAMHSFHSCNFSLVF
jgi:hypothetical protein